MAQPAAFLLLVHLCLSSAISYPCSTGTGDTIALVISRTADSGCSQVDPLSVSLIEHTNTSLQTMGSFASLSAYDFCGNSLIAVKFMSDLTPFLSLGYGGGEAEGVCTTPESPSVIGIITTDTGTAPLPEIITSRKNNPPNPPIISLDIRPTSSRSSENVYYMSELATDYHKILLEVAVKLTWDYIAVIYSADFDSDVREVFEEEAFRRRVCIGQKVVVTASNASSITLDASIKGVVYFGNLVLGPLIVENVDPSGSLNLRPIILVNENPTELDVRSRQVVYAVVPEIKANDQAQDAVRVIKDNCEQASVCYYESVKGQSFQFLEGGKIDYFDSVGTLPFKPFSIVQIHNDTGLRINNTIGSINNEGVVEITPSISPESFCTEADCLQQCTHMTVKPYMYIPGEYMVIITLPLFNSGDGAWSCKLGDWNTENMARALAAKAAIQHLNNHYLVDSTITIGAVIFDSCFNYLKTDKNFTEIMSGSIQICSSTGECLDPDSVVAIISDYSSGTTIEVQNSANLLPIVQVAYGASSAKLDSDDYRYFLRTTPSDARQAQNIATLVGWVSNITKGVHSVGLIYSDTPYGRGGLTIRDSLEQKGIRVSVEKLKEDFEIGELTSFVSEQVNQDVRLFIFFGENSDMSYLLDQFRTLVQLDQLWRTSGSIFVFGDTWGNSQELLSKYGHIVRGSFSTVFSSNFEVSANLLNDSFYGKLIEVDEENPWFSPYAQRKWNCKIRGDFSASWPDPESSEGPKLPLCAERVNSSFINHDGVFLQHLVKALFSVTKAIKTFRCSTGTTKSPTCIRAETDDFYAHTLTTTLGDSTNTAFQLSERQVFSLDGNGAVGYVMLQMINKGNLDLRDYEYSDGLRFDARDKTTEGAKRRFYIYDSTQNREKENYGFSSGRPFVAPVTTPAEEKSSSALVIGLAAALGVIVLGALIGIVIYCLRKTANRSRNSLDQTPMHDTSRSSHYATPKIHHPSQEEVAAGEDNLAYLTTLQEQNIPSPPQHFEGRHGATSPVQHSPLYDNSPMVQRNHRSPSKLNTRPTSPLPPASPLRPTSPNNLTEIRS